MFVRLQLHVAIYRPDSFVLMLSYCANLKAIRYESTSLNIIIADKSHRVIVALLTDISGSLKILDIIGVILSTKVRKNMILIHLLAFHPLQALGTTKGFINLITK